MITRRAAADDVVAGMRVPEGAYLALSLQTVHALWAQPSAWRPERHLPGGEYDAFDADIRPYMARAQHPRRKNPKKPLCNGWKPQIVTCPAASTTRSTPTSGLTWRAPKNPRCRTP